MLHQGTGAIAFFSRAITPRHAKLATYERELIGLVQAVKHWRPYLWGREFVVRTDHQSLKYLLDQRLSTIPQHHWATKLLGYDFRVEFKPGVSNIVADALSRRDEENSAVCNALSVPVFSFFDTLRQLLEADQSLREYKTKDQESIEGWKMVDQLLLKNGKVFVPASYDVVPSLLEFAHGLGHEGIQKTLHRLRSDFHIPGDRRLVREYVRNCETCQRNKTEHLRPGGLLQPLDIPSTVWSDIAMDFIEALPRVNGKTVILTVVDRFSKYAHFIPLGHPYTAASVAKAFFQEIVRLHGLPATIVSDRDPVFTSDFWKELFSLTGVCLQFTSAFHP